MDDESGDDDNKWMRRWVETWLARLTEWIWKLIPKTRRRILAIC